MKTGTETLNSNKGSLIKSVRYFGETDLSWKICVSHYDPLGPQKLRVITEGGMPLLVNKDTGAGK